MLHVSLLLDDFENSAARDMSLPELVLIVLISGLAGCCWCYGMARGMDLDSGSEFRNFGA